MKTLNELERLLKPLFYNQEGYDSYIFTQANKNKNLDDLIQNYKSENKYAPEIKQYMKLMKDGQ